MLSMSENYIIIILEYLYCVVCDADGSRTV